MRCGPPGAVGGCTEIKTWPCTQALISLMPAPLEPMKRPTRLGGIRTSSSPGSAFRLPRTPGKIGHPFSASASATKFSTASMLPTIDTEPYSSVGGWWILMSAPLRLRMSFIVAPPLPRRALICTAGNRKTLWFAPPPTIGGLDGICIGAPGTPTLSSQPPFLRRSAAAPVTGAVELELEPAVAAAACVAASNWRSASLSAATCAASAFS
mmetsp:Transcript_57293/g.159463  ORF Transcript_57293/g.159463 Transcript_57293/m.159463 type:complete len:210 (+) Transcript_57293:285-914(+)